MYNFDYWIECAVMRLSSACLIGNLVVLLANISVVVSAGFKYGRS